MRLVERGLLSLNDRVSDFFPQLFNTTVANATVEELLTHTAGLPESPSIILRSSCPEFPGASVDFCESHPAIGIRHYANWRWANYDTQASDIPNYAMGSCGAGGSECPMDADGPWGGPAGYWTMTIGDLTRFVRAVSAREILTQRPGTSQSTWDWMFETRSDILNMTGHNNAAEAYGFGVISSGVSSIREYWHGGDDGGVTSIWYLRETNTRRTGVAIVCNGGFGLSSTTTLLDAAQAVAADIAAADPTPKIILGSLDQSLLGALPGRTFRLRPEQTRHASRQGTGKRLHLPLAFTREVDVTLSSGRRGLSARVSGMAMAPSWASMCRTSLTADNQACVPWSDGVAACLDVTWDRLTGKRRS